MKARQIVLFIALISWATPVFAQSSGRFTLVRSAVAGGGATFSTSSRFQLGSTLAQPLAAVPNISRFSIQGGFWIGEAPSIFAPTKVGNDFVFSFETMAGKTYALEYSDSLISSSWLGLPSITGDGTVRSVTNSAPSVAQRFYRLIEQ